MANINSDKNKEILIIKDSSSPEARAARLRRIRNMANLSRYEMCENEILNINTYKGWEIARYGGLPHSAAEKVIKRLSKAGLICSKEWLLSGEGHEPYILPQSMLSQESLDTEQLIIKEITAFVSHFNDVVYFKLPDDAMLPAYQKNDYVAGIKKYDHEIASLINTKCIVLTDSGELLVRYLKPGSKNLLYSLYHTNLETKVDKPVSYDVKLEYAATIIRHYRV
jgi:transcriptional regulator with XRE-family HTH domain